MRLSTFTFIQSRFAIHFVFLVFMLRFYRECLSHRLYKLPPSLDMHPTTSMEAPTPPVVLIPSDDSVGPDAKPKRKRIVKLIGECTAREDLSVRTRYTDAGEQPRKGNLRPLSPTTHPKTKYLSLVSTNRCSGRSRGCELE